MNKQKYYLYMAEVTEHEWEAGYGASSRDDGVAFCLSISDLMTYFEDRYELSREADRNSDYSLYETISSPELVLVSEECFHFYKYKCPDFTVLWLRGDSLKEFMKGVER